MKRIIVLILAFLLAALITGCGGDALDKQPAEGARTVKTGRYVEGSIPLEEESGMVRGASVPNGELVYYTETQERVGEGWVMTLWRNTLRGGKVEKAQIQASEDSLLLAQNNISYIASVSESPNGSVVVLFADNEDNDRLARAEADGDFKIIELPGWAQREQGGGETAVYSDALYPYKVIALDDAFLVQYMDEVRHYDADGSELGKYICDYTYHGAAVYGGKIALVTNSRGDIEVYDLHTKKLEFSAPIGLDGDEYALFVGMDADGVFVAAPQGIFRWNGAEWDMVVDGGMTSLIMPDAEIQAVVSDDNGVFYAFLGRGTQITRFYYDENAPIADTELEIFSLYDSATIRKAIGLFQIKNPSVKVNLRVAGGDSSATLEDIIRALNTEILAGNAPDILVLDGLPVSSYIDKGVLKDITELAKEYTEELGLAHNLSKAYERGGRIYGLPTRFSLPVIAGVKEHIAEIDSLSALADMARRLKGGEVPFLYPPESSYQTDVGMLLEYYELCEGLWFKDRTIDEAALAEYFKDMLAINGTIKGGSSYYMSIASAGMYGFSGSETIHNGIMGIINGEAQVNIHTITGIMSLSYYEMMYGERDDLTLESAFRGNQYFPVAGVGIVTGGANQELAEDFTRLLMSREIQDIYLYDGFPVNARSMEHHLDDMSRMLIDNGEDPEKDYFASFKNIYQNLTSAVFIDEVVRSAVIGVLPGLLDGEITPEQAAEQVARGTKLYLAE